MKIIRTLAIMLIIQLAGCSSIQSGIAADSISTFAGLSTSNVTELNPVLPENAMGAAVAAALIKHVMLEIAQEQPVALCAQITKSISSASWGAAANNLVAIAGAPSSVSLTLGLIAALIGNFSLITGNPNKN